MKAKLLIIAALIFSAALFTSCNGCSRNGKTAEQVGNDLDKDIRHDSEAVKREADKIRQDINIADSLRIEKGGGKVVTDKYEGLLPGADVPGIDYSLTLVRQEKRDHGVFALRTNYREAENGRDKTFHTYGRFTTRKGIAGNKAAEYISLVPFGDNGLEVINFAKNGADKLTLLGADLVIPATELNYTIIKVTE